MYIYVNTRLPGKNEQNCLNNLKNTYTAAQRYCDVVPLSPTFSLLRCIDVVEKITLSRIIKNARYK